MRTYRQLRSDARESAQRRGHEMGRFVRLDDYTDLSKARGRCTCKKCGAYVDVDCWPQPNGIDIGGSAVAVNCLAK